MLRSAIRFVVLAVVRFFHRQIAVRGVENLPASGPVLVVANHPNGLIDPIVIRLAVGREVGFMAKAPLFENPLGKLAMGAFAAVPVYRAKDGNDPSANEKTFAEVQQRFGANRWVVIFPEGHSHSEPSLQRLKTGAARIALGFAAAGDAPADVAVLPVGLVYEDKAHFRSRVAVNIGKPIAAAEHVAAYHADEWGACTALTDEIAGGLSRVMLEAESDEVWHGFLAIARWTMPDAVHDVAACEMRAQQLAAAWRRIVTEDLEGAEALAEEARRFVRMLESIGIEDPFSLERPRPPSLARMAFNATGFALFAAPAAAGWALNALPYYGIGPLAERVASSEMDIVSSAKALGGVLFYPLTWIAWGGIAWRFAGWPMGLAALAAGPVCGLVAVRYFEELALRTGALVGFWLRFTRRHVVDSVLARRAELAAKVEAALLR